MLMPLQFSKNNQSTTPNKWKKVDSRWKILIEVRDLRQEEVAEVAMVKAEAAEEEEKAEAEETEEAEVETATPMLDQELVLQEWIKKENHILMLTKSVVVDSKASPETPIQWTDSREEAEVPETQTRRRVALAEATGEPSQTKLTSKAAMLRLQLMARLQRLRRSQSGLRKKSNLSPRLKKSSSELVSMISCRVGLPETRPRQEKLRESRVPRSRP